MKTGNNWLSYTSSNSLYSETFNSAKITINGQDKMISMDASYYRNVLPYETQMYFPRKYIYSYSFSYPGQYQPSGSINYSRIQKANSHLELTFNNTNTIGGSTNGKIRVYGINYNILKIEKGQGGFTLYELIYKKNINIYIFIYKFINLNIYYYIIIYKYAKWYY